MLQELKTKDLRILVIDDESGIRDLLSYELGSQGYLVETAQDGEEGIEKLKKNNFQLVITDIKMPRMDGISTLAEIKKINPEIEVIMATGYGTIETAVEAMKKGAYDFIQKPFNIDEILTLIEKALEKAELKSLIALYETSKAVFSAIKLDDLLPILGKLSIKLLKADNVALMLTDDGGKVYMGASYGLDSDKQGNRILLGKNILENCSDLEDSLIIAAPFSENKCFKDVEIDAEIKSAIISPLMSNGQMKGVLFAVRSVDDLHFNSYDKRYADIFASQVSQSIENATLYKKLESKIEALNEAYAKLNTMKKELVQSEKLAAVGELASGVAHELNNPLTVIIGLVQLMLEDGGVDPEKESDLETVKEQAERCRKIILNLLQFARKHETKKAPVDISEVISKSLELVEYDILGEGIGIVREFDVPGVQVEADLYQIQQVFLNIINNAHYSLRNVKNGKLTIRVRQSENEILIDFVDNGCGIPKGVIGKIFDPFFTTKDVKQGAGLGLSISYGIIKEHAGDITVESKEGKGSVFTIKLPRKLP